MKSEGSIIEKRELLENLKGGKLVLSDKKINLNDDVHDDGLPQI